MTQLSAVEAGAAALAAAAEAPAAAAEALASAAAAAPEETVRSACAASDIGGFGFAFSVIKALIVPHVVALNEGLLVHYVVAMAKNVFTAVILDDESETFLLVKELANACLAHVSVSCRLEAQGA